MVQKFRLYETAGIGGESSGMGTPVSGLRHRERRGDGDTSPAAKLLEDVVSFVTPPQTLGQNFPFDIKTYRRIYYIYHKRKTELQDQHTKGKWADKGLFHMGTTAPKFHCRYLFYL